MDYARLFPFWAQLSLEEKDALHRSAQTVRHKKGALMHRSAENCKGLMAILTGQMRTYILSDEGREVTLFRVHAGDVCVLSASCLLDAVAFDVLIEATEDTDVLMLPSPYLSEIMENNPYLELYLYKTAAEKFTDVVWTMQQILFRKVDQRVAQFIWDETARTGALALRITHDEIARYIGSAREVVSKVLKYLAEHQAVELRRGVIHVLDKEKLKIFL
jgi:CRP/FNR family transcriptional regulator